LVGVRVHPRAGVVDLELAEITHREEEIGDLARPLFGAGESRVAEHGGDEGEGADALPGGVGIASPTAASLTETLGEDDAADHVLGVFGGGEGGELVLPDLGAHLAEGEGARHLRVHLSLRSDRGSFYFRPAEPGHERGKSAFGNIREGGPNEAVELVEFRGLSDDAGLEHREHHHRTKLDREARDVHRPDARIVLKFERRR
jgi:hypothetical protein